MTPSPTPLERLIDALQAALLTAQSIHRGAHDLAGESDQLLNAVQRAGLAVQDFRPPTDRKGGAQ